MVRSFIVTGASRGLGLEFVRQLAKRGDIVYACARNPASSKELQSLVDNKQVFAIKLDTTSEESIKTAADEISKNAPAGIDVLINNAGINGTMGVNAENTPKEDYQNVFATNVIGVSEVLKGFLPILRQRGQENTKIVMNMSSLLGSMQLMTTGDGLGYGGAYCVSKAAVNMLTKMFANQLAHENFIVYASDPGWVKTDMGTSNAPLEVHESISGQLAKLDSLTPADNGGFFDYEGGTTPW